MDSSHHALAPSGSRSPMPRRSKVNAQRQYRANEGECFNTLREVISELTGEELQTRQEILRKAIHLLLAASEIRKLREARVVRPTLYETRAIVDSEDATSAHMGYSAESSRSPKHWQPTVEFDAQSAYYISQLHGQNYDLMFDMDSALNQATDSFRGYGQD